MSGINISPILFKPVGIKLARTDEPGKTIKVPPPQVLLPPPLPNPAPEIDKALAIIYFNDGQGMVFGEEDLENLDTDLPRPDYLERKFGLFKAVLIKINDKYLRHETKDPALEVLYRLEELLSMAAAKALPPYKINKLVNALLKFVAGLPASFSDKPYLLLLVIKKLWDKKLISREVAEELFIKLAHSDRDDLVLQEALCRFYVSIGRFDLAASHFSNSLSRRIPEADARGLNTLRKSTDAILKGISDALLIHKLGDYLRLWGANETDFQKAKELLMAASRCYYRALPLDQSDTAKFAHYLKMADLDQEFSKLYSKKSEYSDQAVSRQYQRMAIRNYEAVLPVLRDAPDKAALLIKVGDLHFADFGDDKANLEKAAKYFEQAKTSINSSDLSIRLAAVYARMGKFDQAIGEIRAAIKNEPDNPVLYALLGDLYFASGKVTDNTTAEGVQLKGDFRRLEAVMNAYQVAFSKAGKKGPEELAFIQQKFIRLRTRARMEMASHPSDNILVGLIRMAGEIFYFSNPINMAAQILSLIINPSIPYQHTKPELRRFLDESREMEISTWKYSVRPEADISFLLFNLKDLVEMDSEVGADLKKGRDLMISLEKVKALKEIKQGLETAIKERLKAIGYLSGRSRPFAHESINNMVKHLAGSFQGYLSLLQFLQRKDISPAIREQLKGFEKNMWQRLLKEIELALETARNERRNVAVKIPIALQNLINLAAEVLHEIPEKEKLAALMEVLENCYETIFNIAEDKKDYFALLEIAKNKELGILSVAALKAALSLAEEAKQPFNLKQEVAKLAISLTHESEKQSLRQAYAIIGRRALLAVIKHSRERREQALAAIDLWRLGFHADSIDAFEKIAVKLDVEDNAQLTIDLAFMHLSLDRGKEALAYFKRAKALLSPRQDKVSLSLLKLIDTEMKAVKENAPPPDMVIGKNAFFSSRQLRAVIILYSRWFKDDLKTSQQAIDELTRAQGYIIDVKAKAGAEGNVPTFSLNTKTIIGIDVRGNKKTKLDVIFKELEFGKIKQGVVFNREKIDAALIEMNKRLQSFGKVDWEIEETESGIILVLNLRELSINVFGKLEGGGGNAGGFISVSGGKTNLFGGGEKLGATGTYRWIKGGGYRPFSLFEGKLFYHDPRLISWGGRPISLDLSVERFGRRDYIIGSQETATGGNVGLGLFFTPRTSLAFSTSLYHISNYLPQAVIPSFYKQGAGFFNPFPVHKNFSYFRQGNKLTFTHDHRNHWLYPTSGYYFSIFAEPGFYSGNGPISGFLSSGFKLQKYFALPGGFSVMLGLKGLLGTGLRGGDQYFLGDGFVRSNNNLSNFGQSALGISHEIKSPPLLKLDELKIQPYLFLDAGCVFKSSGAKCGVGIGAGIRFFLFGILPIDLFFGWPGGFGWRVSPD